MKNKYIFTAVMLLALMLAGIGLTELYVSHERTGEKQDTFHVVASFYPMYIAAENIIDSCEGVSLTNLSEPQTGCLHDYQLTPQDMVKLSGADAFIVNGGGIESFLSETARQYPKLAVISACERVELLEENAHAWMSLPDYMIQVQTITDGLAALDPAHADIYQKNCGAYLAKLEDLCLQQEALREVCAGESVVIFHEAFAYTAADYGFLTAGSLDLDEERQISAGEAAEIVSLIQEHGVSMILAEELYGRKLCETIQKETDVRIVYLDTCVRGSYEADSYLKAVQNNMDLLRQALPQEGGE